MTPFGLNLETYIIGNWSKVIATSPIFAKMITERSTCDQQANFQLHVFAAKFRYKSNFIKFHTHTQATLAIVFQWEKKKKGEDRKAWTPRFDSQKDKNLK